MPLKTTKVCNKCHIEKPISEFYKRNDTSDGLHVYCKRCVMDYNNTYRKKSNRGKIRLRNKDYSDVTEQECSNCRIIKPLSDFAKDKNRVIGYRKVCKSCTNEQQRIRYQDKNGTRRKYLIENRDDRLEMYREIKYKKMYGLSLDEVTKMHEECNYKCAICGEKFDWLCVDHNHKTGAVRDLLCKNCNSGIGMYKDNPELVKRAYEYLIKHNKEVGE